MLAVAFLLIIAGRPNKSGISPKFLRFDAALVLIRRSFWRSLRSGLQQLSSVCCWGSKIAGRPPLPNKLFVFMAQHLPRPPQLPPLFVCADLAMSPVGTFRTEALKLTMSVQRGKADIVVGCAKV